MPVKYAADCPVSHQIARPVALATVPPWTVTLEQAYIAERKLPVALIVPPLIVTVPELEIALLPMELILPVELIVPPLTVTKTPLSALLLLALTVPQLTVMM